MELTPSESNVFAWRAVLQGPAGSPYEGGAFELAISVPEQYPLVPPEVKFRTKIFHPNVHFKASRGCRGAGLGALPPAQGWSGAGRGGARTPGAARSLAAWRGRSVHPLLLPPCLVPSLRFHTLSLSRHLTPPRPPPPGTQTGEICLDILKSAWSPAWTLQSVCQAVLALMSDSAPDSPLNCDAGNLLRAGDVRGYNSLARMYTIECAMAAPRS